MGKVFAFVFAIVVAWLLYSNRYGLLGVFNHATGVN